ncbi:MAG: aminoacyl-tRNA hydrolase [Endomicrobium sp.]|jgi:PTH1 family peptidyl-tRNA hydrolase|nr:aminoacyl-tRNA hydrolase [Endomicrobium sp.]
MSIRLFVGLGNPTDQYKNTRHNFGFIVLDSIAQAKSLEFKNWNSLADISFYSKNPQEKIYLLKPLTFMNNSGDAVADFAKYYKIAPNEIFVFYDDFAINLGTFRVRLSGSSAGHNGLKSLISRLGGENFARMKLGIGPIPEYMKTIDFVLSKFRQEEKEAVDLIVQKAVSFFDEVINLGLEKAISALSIK